nr:hypothetical protein GCM10020093_078500 [Planobispora longispora]
MIFAARDDEAFPASGLPEITLSRLGPEDARMLIDERGGRSLPPAVRDRIIAESAGNPLALIEFGAAQREEPRTLGRLPVTDRVLASFQGRIGRLSERARLMLLILAAEARGHLPSVLGAAAVMGVGLEDLGEAERAGLVRISGRVTDTAAVFRHPLILAAAYQGRRSRGGWRCTRRSPRPPPTPTAGPATGPPRRRPPTRASPRSWRGRAPGPGQVRPRRGRQAVRAVGRAHPRPSGPVPAAGRRGGAGPARRGHAPRRRTGRTGHGPEPGPGGTGPAGAGERDGRVRAG